MSGSFKGSPELAETLGRAHETLSALTATPFSATDEALEQTSTHLHSTARYLTDSNENLIQAQTQLATLVSRIQYVKEFLPEIGHSQHHDSEEDEDAKE
ncbi:hypothetical protein BGX29_005262 [Mortierella sp. GBA35]|nr:hypothetical protein BGX23_008068 [Mortierella sp. AD031]KAF9101788.1 hypothetical protein BGX29_005262 [Mortierella sp. GBA35]KAG0208423.1 hypothetical protein BGX33_006251 [Mortierella sp. NVP41]